MRKNFVISLVCKILGKAMPYVCARDTRAYATFKNLPDLSFSLGVLGDPDYVVLKKSGDQILRVKNSTEADLKIMFKNRRAALRVMLGSFGVAESFARHDILLSGNINTAVALTRIIDLEEYYLFPRLITRKFLPKMKKEFCSLKLYGFLLFGSAKKLHIVDPGKIKELKQQEKLSKQKNTDTQKPKPRKSAAAPETETEGKKETITTASDKSKISKTDSEVNE